MELLTACTMDCPDACSLSVTVRGGKAVKLRGNAHHPFTAGFTCRKIKKHLERLHSPERIRHPLLRMGNSWRTISWDAALDLCAEKITALQDAPLAIAHVHGSGAKGVLKEAVSLFFDRLGASRTRGSLCDAAGVLAYHYDFGSRKNHHFEDINNAHRIINWGRGLSRTNIHMAAMVRKVRKQGVKVLLVSPCQEGDLAFRDHHILLRPGTDRLLAAAVVRRLIVNNAVDAGTIQRTRHWAPFRDLILGLEEDTLRRVCDITRKDVDLLYDYYTAQGPAATLVGGGLQRHGMGGENVRFINALALLSGHIGRQGGGSYFHLHGTGHFNMAWAKAGKRTKRRSLQLAGIGRELNTADLPAISMLWVNGLNLVNQASHSHQTIRAFDRIPFKVVVDAFMNDTASRADLILPSALMLEQEDVIGSYLHHFIHYVQRVVDPPGEARDDHWIVRELAIRLDPAIELPTARQCLEAALKSPGPAISLEELKQKGFYEVPIEKVAYARLKFDHPDGKARLPLQIHHEDPALEAFPLRLLSLAPRNTLQSQMLSKDHKALPRVWVSPRCTALENLDTETPVDIVSPLGRLRVKVKMMDDLHPEAVVYRRGDWMARGGGINQLIDEHTTNIGGGAAYYQQWVRLENPKETAHE